MRCLRVALLAACALGLAVSLAEARQRGYRPPPPRIEPYRPPVYTPPPRIETYHPPTYTPRPGEIYSPTRPGGTGIYGHSTYEPPVKSYAEIQRDLAQQRYQSQLRTYEEARTKYLNSEEHLTKAMAQLKSGKLSESVKLLESGYTGASAPVKPVDPAFEGLGLGTRPSSSDLGFGGSNSIARKQFLAEYREAVVKKVSASAQPWEVFTSLRAEAGVGRLSECKPFTKEVLTEAATVCSTRSLKIAREAAEAGDWGKAVSAAKTARGELDAHVGSTNSPTLSAQKQAFEAIVRVERGPAQVKALADALRAAGNGDAAALKSASAPDLSPEVLKPLRAAQASNELNAALKGENLPPAHELNSLIAEVRTADPKLADRVAVDVSGRLFLNGKAGEATEMLGKVAGNDAVAAKALLRDLKAVALGEGAVTTDAGRAAFEPATGGPTTRGPPATRHLVPEGERAGYRPPVVEKATADLPELGGELKVATKAAQAKVEAELANEPARIERRRTVALANSYHLERTAVPPTPRPALSVLEPPPAVVAEDLTEEEIVWQVIGDDAFLEEVEDQLGRPLTAEEKKQIKMMRGPKRAITPAAVVRFLKLKDQPEKPANPDPVTVTEAPVPDSYLREVADAIGRPLSQTEERVAAYLYSRKYSAAAVTAWAKGEALPALPQAPAAPAPHEKAEAEADR